MLTTLEGEFFPVAVEVGPDDAIHAAAFVSDGDRDFWVYEPGDYKRRLRESVSDEGDGIRARQVGVAADGRATVILSDRPETLIVRDY